MPAQVAIAWMLAQGEDIIPIPSTTRVEVRRLSKAAFIVDEAAKQVLHENRGALNLRLLLK